LNIPRAQVSDTGDYYVVVSNPAGMHTSDTVHVTVNQDNVPPHVVSAHSAEGTAIGVCYDELLDLNPDPLLNTATDPFNYAITADSGPTAPMSISMRPDGRSVQIILQTPISGHFTVTATGVRDATGRDANAGGGTIAGRVAGFTSLDVGVPTQAGSIYTCKEGDYDVVAGGADIWGNADQGHLTLLPRTGDFDVRVQIAGLTLANAISKAGLMGRETMTADSRTLYMSVNPPAPGRDQGEAGMRVATAGATAAWTANTNYIPVGIPNAWQRMTRSGDNFKAYRSSDGVNWTLFAETTQVYPATMLVGFGTTAHDNAVGPTTALYRHFQFVPTVPYSLMNMSYTPGTFSFSFSTQSGFEYVIEYKNTLPGGNWTVLQTVTGDGSVKVINDGTATVPTRFYHVRVQ
jgi:hypothetical protein